MNCVPDGRGWPIYVSGETKVSLEHERAPESVAAALSSLIERMRRGGEELVVLCVGTDRSTGDALGPLVGSFLAEAGAQPFHVYGTLDQPVHASNLKETLEWLNTRHRRPLVVAVDACLGRVDSVGTITIGKGALRPGAGVNKSLPPVGDVYVTGVVNVGGFMEYFVLQNTRLGLVVRMAKVIAAGVRQAALGLLAAYPGARTDNARG